MIGLLVFTMVINVIGIGVSVSIIPKALVLGIVLTILNSSLLFINSVRLLDEV